MWTHSKAYHLVYNSGLLCQSGVRRCLWIERDIFGPVLLRFSGLPEIFFYGAFEKTSVRRTIFTFCSTHNTRILIRVSPHLFLRSLCFPMDCTLSQRSYFHQFYSTVLIFWPQISRGILYTKKSIFVVALLIRIYEFLTTKIPTPTMIFAYFFLQKKKVRFTKNPLSYLQNVAVGILKDFTNPSRTKFNDWEKEPHCAKVECIKNQDFRDTRENLFRNFFLKHMLCWLKSSACNNNFKPSSCIVV